MINWCPSCCSSCFIDPPHPADITDSPFALRKLLAAGTIHLQLNTLSQHQVCAHSHAEDDWHILQPSRLLTHIKEEVELTLCRELDFLIHHEFLLATYREFNDMMSIRIYIVPYDLANVQGRLRNRKEAIVSPARRYFQRLLPRISQDIASWNGVGLASGVRPLFSDLPVCSCTSATPCALVSNLDIGPANPGRHI